MVFVSFHHYNLLEWKLPYFRSIILISMMISAVVAGVMWKMLFNVEYGSMDYLLNLFNIEKIPWFGKSLSSKISVIIMDIWQWTPFILVKGKKELASWIFSLECCLLLRQFYLSLVLNLKLYLYFKDIFNRINPWYSKILIKLLKMEV